MKDKPNQQKLVLKIVSVFAAVVLWFFVTYTEDELIDINVNSLGINMVGEQSLISKGLMVVNKASVGKASVKIRGRRGDLISVMDNVRASIDLSRIESAGEYDLTPSFDIPSNTVYVSKRNTLSVGVDVEEIVEKTVEVSVIQSNEDKNKEFVVESVPEVGEISVRGSVDDISKIGKAVLQLDASTVTEDGEQVLKIVFADENGDKIEFVNELYCDLNEIKVRNKLYPKKTVDVLINFPYSYDERYSYELIGQSFDEINVGITDKARDFKTVTADFSNITNIMPGKHKYILDIRKYNGIYIPEKYRQVEVEVNVTENIPIEQ